MMDTYFTLSLLDNEDLYVSDTKHASRNPSWHLLPESIPSEKLADEKGKYRLTLWGRKSADSVEDPDGSREYRVISEWTLDFSSLEFVGTDLADHEKVFPANTPLFEFLDGFYTLAKAGNMEDAEESLPVKVDHQKVKGSYKLECINRIVAAQKEILLIQDSINTLQRSSEALASRKSKLTATERRAEILGRIAFIEKEMTARTQSIQSSRLKLKEMKEILAIRNRQLRESGPDRESTRHGLDLKQAELARTKLGCSKTCAHISFRQRRLIFDMKSIYPIELGLVGNLMSIRGIKLPNSEFSGFDDERISTGLGYTAHLIIMIATYLEVPLRYPSTLCHHAP
ncbi:hypothetical protein BC829DRAFT_298717 [Chytridium lagenaria]|nr:hypothetical protein BC829DRAFT_298717 [Chytridium lagenaria]